MSESYDAQWRCELCKVYYVVPGLARDCEARHQAELALLEAV